MPRDAFRDARRNGRLRPLFDQRYGGYSGDTVGTMAFSVVLAGTLLLLGLPLFLLIALIIKIFDPGPVFYRGERLGRHKRVFLMYKFRTLPVNAQGVLGPHLLPADSGMVTPFAKLLRDTRLDELPQLLNVLKGDMDFVGPRPERPEIYETQGRELRNYDIRFRVKPGLIGYSQLFTPHGAPKRMRVLIDNQFVMRRRSRLWDLVMIGYTIWVVARTVAVRGVKLLVEDVFRKEVRHDYVEKRRQERVQAEGVRVGVRRDPSRGGRVVAEGVLGDISSGYLRILTNDVLGDGELQLVLTRDFRRLGCLKRKTARCRATVFRGFASRDGSHAREYVLRYEALSPLNAYALDQYFFVRSLA